MKWKEHVLSAKLQARNLGLRLRPAYRSVAVYSLEIIMYLKPSELEKAIVRTKENVLVRLLQLEVGRAFLEGAGISLSSRLSSNSWQMKVSGEEISGEMPC